MPHRIPSFPFLVRTLVSHRSNWSDHFTNQASNLCTYIWRTKINSSVRRWHFWPCYYCYLQDVAELWIFRLAPLLPPGVRLWYWRYYRGACYVVQRRHLPESFQSSLHHSPVHRRTNRQTYVIIQQYKFTKEFVLVLK